ncbi:hypothetical protein QBC40DRAFT_51200 [Triangularia verruculosa]|uniref:Uncharacterized protein n=1 Tax=Triangularia verruculosa TaxID=2587418 RepID=A0AAN6XRR9_9PEZI|nr:hypothetical protein QBC40DRAFT_51200 [Triangularia verruculosa]
MSQKSFFFRFFFFAPGKYLPYIRPCLFFGLIGLLGQIHTSIHLHITLFGAFLGLPILFVEGGRGVFTGLMFFLERK